MTVTVTKSWPSVKNSDSLSTCFTTRACGLTYQTTGVPESFLLDKNGIVVKRVIGWHDWSAPANRGLIERLLDQPDS